MYKYNVYCYFYFYFFLSLLWLVNFDVVMYEWNLKPTEKSDF